MALIASILFLILLAGVLEGLMKMPILHIVNVIAALCWISVLTLSFVAPLIDAGFSTSLCSLLNASPLYDFFLRTNPFQLIF